MEEQKQEERRHIVVCRNGQDISSGLKFTLKPGESLRIGRARENEVVLDYEAASKHHAEISLRETLPEEVPAGSGQLPTILSLRDLSSKNGIGIRKTPFEKDSLPSIGSFEQLDAKTSQVLEDGCCILIPAKSRRENKQMALRERMITFHVSTVMVDVPVPKPAAVPAPTPVVEAPAQDAPVAASAYADLAEVVRLTDKPKSKAVEPEPELFVRPAEGPGLPTMTPGEVEGRDVSAPKDVEGRDVPAPKEVEGRDVPAPKVGILGGLTQRAFGSLWRGKARAKVPASSDEETTRAFTQANVARVSAAAARAAGVLEPLPDMDFELRSVSPISTPGVFPWQLSLKKKEKKAKKKKRVGPSPSTRPPSTRADSPQSSVVTEVTVPAPKKKKKDKGEAKAPKKRKEKGDASKAPKSKKPKLTANAGPKWDPYMQRDSSP